MFQREFQWTENSQYRTDYFNRMDKENMDRFQTLRGYGQLRERGQERNTKRSSRGGRGGEEKERGRTYIY
jgi:hypothetical protein